MQKTETYLTAQYFLNHKLDKVEVKRQIGEFADKGYQGVFGHARQGLLTPYMSKEWWDIIDVIINECESRGMKFQIWDEDYFPSAIAGGRTVWENPELAARNMNFTIQTFDACDEIELDFKKGYLLGAFAIELDAEDKAVKSINITEYCGTRRQQWTERYLQHVLYTPLLAMSGNPHWRSNFTDNRFAVCWQPLKKVRYAIIGITVDCNFSRTCLMDERTTKAMLDSTYEEYFKRYGEYFGNLIEGVFFDEPSGGSEIYPWSANFSDEFFKDHSYSILDELAHLAMDIDEKSPVVRADFRKTQHRLMVSGYLEQSREWCERHSLIFRGHLTRTEWLSLAAAWWPNQLRCYKYVDIPCCDPLGKAYGFKDTAAYHTGIKVVSSAARIFGKQLAGSDCLAVIGDEVSLRDLKGMLDYQMALGINFFVLHGYSYSIEGPRKDEVPPSIFYQHSEWDYMGKLSEHVKEVCQRLSEASPSCGILMLYPSTSLAAQQKPKNDVSELEDVSWDILNDEKRTHALVDDLLSTHRDFNFIDEVTLDEVVCEDGTLSLGCGYDAIVLPYVRYIPENTAKALYRYAGNGGKVVVVGEIPTILSATPEKLQVQSMESVKENPSDLLTPTVEIKGDGASDIFVSKYLEHDKNIFFLYNRSTNVFRGTCEGIPVQVQALSGLMVDDSYALDDIGEEVQELNTGWEVEFEENKLALSFMQVYEDIEIDSADYIQGKPYDLMTRSKNPASENASKLMYRYRLTSMGDIDNAKIVMDESAISGEWQVLVNGVPIEKWTKKRFYDCNNIYSNIKLKSGTSQQLNLIDILVEHGSLQDMPYLYGGFKCSFPHGHKSFPELVAARKKTNAEILFDWGTGGYPTYSGAAVYTRTFEVPKAGRYIIDLGRVEDIAEISIDNGVSEILAWPPYRLEVLLAAGGHSINVKVTNAPGNMYRNARLPAGLIGPVKILTKKNLENAH